jgi:hypothetical protein
MQIPGKNLMKTGRFGIYVKKAEKPDCVQVL